jgi:copper chaperone NosL
MDANVEGWRWPARLAWGAAGLLVVVGLGFTVAWTERSPEGPMQVVWDRESCAHCRMHVGEPGFAAQLQTKDGRVLFFDDPGCLLRYEAEAHPEVHAVYFHHVSEERWLPRERTAFLRADPTPMGYGLGAVEAGTSGSISFEAALAGLRRERGE